MRRIVYIGTLARNPRCSRHRRVDEAHISTPVAVDQRTAKCLEKDVCSLTAMQSRCRSSRTHHLPSPIASFSGSSVLVSPLLSDSHP
ncbi:hypothetical protein TNCV_3745431 [Trichonephila clavipes]|nr:hypothetical protein TNCV_3745431 [Trichonephila clavipes]